MGERRICSTCRHSPMNKGKGGPYIGSPCTGCSSPPSGNKWEPAEAELPTAAGSGIEVPDEIFYGIGKWLSAAMEDPNVCEEMKRDAARFLELGDKDFMASHFGA